MAYSNKEFIKKVIQSKCLQSPCLEIGPSAATVFSVKDEILQAGIEYFSTDFVSNSYVYQDGYKRIGIVDFIPDAHLDFVVNFEDPIEIKKCFGGKQFRSIIMLSILEHVFDPIRFLDNAFEILTPGGTCVIVTPCVCPLHKVPYDCWRINPDFYEQYAERRNLELMDTLFEYLGNQAINVKGLKTNSGEYVLPTPSQNKYKTLYSRIIHKLFNTYGRGMGFPSHLSIGVVIRKHT